MADILVQPAVPSLFTHTESASSLIVDSPTTDPNNNNPSTIHHSRTSPNNTNNNNPHTTNKYIGHVSRLRSVFTQYALTLNDLKPGEHRSRYSNHHHQDLASPTRGTADGADDHSLSPPPPILPLATTSSSTLIERSRSLSNPRILDNPASATHLMRSGMSSLTVGENPPTVGANNEDHTLRFRKAKEMFQTLEEEASRPVVSTSAPAKVPSTHRQQDHFSNGIYQPDFMHDDTTIVTQRGNTEHIPDLIIDHRQQQQQLQPTDGHSNRGREIPVQFFDTAPSPSPTLSDRSFITVPIHRATPPIPPLPPAMLLSDDVPYAMVHRKQLHSDQHYDFPKESLTDSPADAVEQLKKSQRHDDTPTENANRPSNEEMANRIVASILPSNILKRMDHLNTKFIKPTIIDQPLPLLSFQDNDLPTSVRKEEQNGQHDHQEIQIQEEEEEAPKWIENPMLNGK